MICISPKKISRTFCFIFLSKNCYSIEKETTNFLILLKKIIINSKKAIKEKSKDI